MSGLEVDFMFGSSRNLPRLFLPGQLPFLVLLYHAYALKCTQVKPAALLIPIDLASS